MIGKLENFSTVFLILGGRNLTDIRLVYVTVEFIGYVVHGCKFKDSLVKPEAFLIHADIDGALSRSGITEIRYLINLLGTFLTEQFDTGRRVVL